MKSQKVMIQAIFFIVFAFYSYASQPVSGEKISQEKAVSESIRKKYSEEDFFSNPPEEEHQISPDGQYLTFKAEWKGYRNLFIRKIGSQDPPIRLTSETERDIGSYFWKGSKILYLKDQGGDENFHLYIIEKMGKGEYRPEASYKGRDLTPFPGVRVELVNKLPGKAEEILIMHNQREKKYFDLYRLNIKTGVLALLVRNPGNIASPHVGYGYPCWFTDAQGRVRLAIQIEGIELKLLHRSTDTEPFQEILSWQHPDVAQVIGFTEDNQKIYLSSSIGRDKAALVLFNLKTKSEEKILYAHPEVDVFKLGFAFHKPIPAFAEYLTTVKKRTFFDSRTKEFYAFLEQKFPGYQVDIEDADQEGKKYLIKISNPRTFGKIYLFEKKSKKLTPIADLNPSIKEEDMGNVTAIEYVARDGLKIPAYLTLPLHAKAENLPTLIFPHGGPDWRDPGTYNPHVQYFVNRGYAVLQPNFRGSTGYGKAFVKASFREWGGKMQDDLTDGVQWLIEKKIADPKRIVIYGGSYGGYATLMGLAKTPDLYAAAIDIVGVSNISSFLNSLPPYWSHLVPFYHVEIGDPEKEPAFIQSISPLFQVHRMKKPLFIAQGGKDPRVVQKESDQIVEALQKQGVEVEYMLLPDEGHGFSKAAHVVAFYQKLSGFLDKYIDNNSDNK